MDTEYEDRARALGFSLKPSDYFRGQGDVTDQQDQRRKITHDNVAALYDLPQRSA